MSDPLELPIRQSAARIVEAVQTNDVVVVIGETGSGKTTQISQVGRGSMSAPAGPGHPRLQFE